MFNLLIESNSTAWETDALMRMSKDRFKEASGIEADLIKLSESNTLRLLEKVPSLLMYERNSEGPNIDVVRYGILREIRVVRTEITFRFSEEGRFSREMVEEFADRLGIDSFEFNRTHWAIKDGDIPKKMLANLIRSYDVVLSFAGEDRPYVAKVAKYLRNKGIRVFYDRDEEADLWGKNLAEHFDWVYRSSGNYCVPFISKSYVRKMWTRHERRAALGRALKEREEYILPARFDDSSVPGISSEVAYIPLADKSPSEFGKLILKKLGKPSSTR